MNDTHPHSQFCEMMKLMNLAINILFHISLSKMAPVQYQNLPVLMVNVSHHHSTVTLSTTVPMEVMNMNAVIIVYIEII